jgi:hypothetical protein
MNILLVKTDSIRFGTCRPKEITFGGVDLAAICFGSIVKSFPEHTFYLVGSNDIPTAGMPDNLIDLETPIKAKAKESGNVKYKAGVDYCKENNLTFDKALVWYGPSVGIAQYDDGYLTKSGTVKKPLESQKFISNGLALATKLHVPTYYILNDARQFNSFPMDADMPKMVISQMNGTIQSKAYVEGSKIDTCVRSMNVVYKPIELMWLLSKKKVDWRNFKKDNRLIFTVNGFPYKLKYIKKWILDYLPDEVIYGKWTSPKSLWESIEKKGLAKNFEYRPMSTMEDKMFSTKYTLVIPLAKEYPAFVTQKVISMMYYGIIPFWCIYDYDSGNLYKDIPEYIKVKSPEEFYAKMDELDNNEELYNQIKNQLYDLLLDKYFTIDFVKEMFEDVIND